MNFVKVAQENVYRCHALYLKAGHNYRESEAEEAKVLKVWKKKEYFSIAFETVTDCVN